jgi:hypothetical protein
MIAEFDVALNFTVQKQVFTARQLTLDNYGLANVRDIGAITFHFRRLHGAGLNWTGRRCDGRRRL